MTEVIRAAVVDYEAYVPYLEAVRVCPGCGAATASEWAALGSYRAVTCDACHLVYMQRILSDEGFSKYYEGYITFRLEHATEKLRQRADMYAIDRDYLGRHVAGGRLLDVGCSGGDFLRLLQDRFECHGLERDPSAVAHARAHGGPLADRIRQGTVEDGLDGFEPMDVVVMRGVIEHFAKPADVLARIAALLRPGGTVFISATPNVECPCADVFREKWNQFDPVQHITHFSASTLAAVAAPHGLRLTAQYYPYLDTPYARPAEDLVIVRRAVVQAAQGRRDEMPRSPAFWGNMMTLVFERQ